MSLGHELPILILDDDFMSCKVVEHYLTSGGFSVEVFEHVADALVAVEARKFALVVSDWFMPEMNGEAFLRRVHQLRPDTPMIFLTGNTDIENAVAMIRSGANDYLVKPVSQHELLFRVGRALEQHANALAVAQVRREKELLEAENRQMINWRLMYATKESDQVKKIISLLARTINHTGGFMWLDLLKASTRQADEGYILPPDIHDLILNAAGEQRHIIELLTYINLIQTMELHCGRISPGDFISGPLEIASQEAGEIARNHGKDLRLVTGRVAEIKGFLNLDTSLVTPILRELVVNAVKYSPPKSRILAECRVEEKAQGGRVLTIHLRNPVAASRTSGVVGIPYELSEQIFELFHTLNAYPERLPEEEWSDGTGLYIVRKLLQRMGAWIEAKNGLDYMVSPPEPFVQFILMFPLEKE